MATGSIRISADSLADVTVFVPELATDHAEQQFGVGASMLRQLRADIIPVLESWTSTQVTSESAPEAASVARILRNMASALAPPPLSDIITDEYPTPIAMAFRRYADAQFNVYEQVLRLRDLFEAAANLVFNVLAADVYRRLGADAYGDAGRSARNACRRSSMHARMQFVAQLIETASQRGDDQRLFVPELSDTTVATSASDLQRNFRNRISHTAVARPKQQERLLREFAPAVMTMLDELACLRSYRLARILSYHFSGGALLRRSEVHRGVVPGISEARVETTLAAVSAIDQSHVVLIDADDQVLDLYPFYQVVEDERTSYEAQIAFLKDRDEASSKLRGETVGGLELELPGYAALSTLESPFVVGKAKRPK